MSVHPFIEAEKQGGHSVKRACELLGVSRAAFYARRTAVPGPRAVRDAELAERIAVVHARSRDSYGVPRVHAQLRQDGQRCGRRRVARLMRALGLAGRYQRRRRQTTVPDPQASLRPDLIERDFTPDAAAIDTRWCGDITYIATEEGWLYLATVIDIASRRVVGWATADHLRTGLVAEALQQACARRRPAGPVIFHSDRGCQYTSAAYAELATRLGVRLSVGRTGQCWDNALAESFFATIKGELLDTRPWPTRAAARRAIFEFVESWYNLHRLHSSLGYRSPADYEAARAA
ncbi:IS3 family transposase [Nonomuraea sp. NN258]|uniref:IS3 family transposase n=1 Tax=Nonomuraea antri TaxID=2730852 RepID=UPI0015681692|nr:IS3 family transposase [Nonomuraea antri]NRQ32971.1 IS3 family transposase [Nonomuraea antri]